MPIAFSSSFARLSAAPVLAACWRLAALLVLLVTPFMVQAAPALKEVAPPAPLTPLLWEVEIGTARAYVFGTVHALPKGTDWLKPHVVKALDQSKTLVLEALMPDNPASLAATSGRLAYSLSKRPLTGRVPENYQPQLMSAIQRFQLDPSVLEHYDSWFLSLILTNAYLDEKGYSPSIGAEAVLSARANLRAIPITGLETPEEQLRNFDSLSEADQHNLLITTLEALNAPDAGIDKLVDAWLKGDSAAISASFDQEFDRTPMLRRLLLEDRNIRWANWLQNRLSSEEGPLFIAVGAGHLSGKANLLDELQRRGFIVRPVLPPVEAPVKSRRRKP